MQKFLVLAAIVYLLPTDAIAQNNSAVCQSLLGAKVVADDGTFLGTIASPYDSNSIFNEYSKGSPYRAESIWNKYGKFGSEYNSLSATNPYTSKPPMLIKDGNVIGYLTKNKYKEGAVDPVVLGIACFDKVIE